MRNRSSTSSKRILVVFSLVLEAVVTLWILSQVPHVTLAVAFKPAVGQAAVTRLLAARGTQAVVCRPEVDRLAVPTHSQVSF